jgi:hypothetical protein
LAPFWLQGPFGNSALGYCIPSLCVHWDHVVALPHQAMNTWWHSAISKKMGIFKCTPPKT